MRVHRSRTRSALLGAAVACCVFASCSTGDGSSTGGRSSNGAAPGVAVASAIEEPTEPQLPVTVTSADGEEVTVTDVSRIVSLRASISEVVFALGLGGNVVARDESTTFDEASDVPVVTDGHQIAAEALLSLKPSVVLVDSDTGPPEVISQLRSVGVPVVVFEPVTSLRMIDPHMDAVARALGLGERGAQLATKTRERIEGQAAYRRADGTRPRVAFLYLRGNAGIYLLGGPASGADAMIEAAGGTDVGTESGMTRAFTPLTSEALVSAAPEILLLTTTGLESVGGIEGLLAMPGVQQTPAGAHRRIVTIEDGLLYGFGVRTPQTIRALAERFSDLDTPGVANSPSGDGAAASGPKR